MKKILLLLVGLITLLFASCENDEKGTPEKPDEHEVITRATLTLTNRSNEDDVVVFEIEVDQDDHAHDEDGDDHDDDGDDHEDDEDGHDADDDHDELELEQTGLLKNNTTYDVLIDLFNDDKGGISVIDEEIINEKLNHQFFYIAEGGLTFAYAYADEDAEGNPVGIETTLTTGIIATDASIEIILKHKPTKGSDVTIIDYKKAGGSTDFEVDIDTVEVETSVAAETKI